MPCCCRSAACWHDGTVRAFLAVLPPEQILEDLDAYLQPRRDADGPGAWRWTRVEQLHLTLAFMADLPDRCEDVLVEAAQAWAARQEPLPLHLSGAGAFPDPGRAKVLWVGVQPDAAAQELARWGRALRDLASHAGAQVDGMRFTPHVSVARSGRPQRAGRWVQALDAYRSAEFAVAEAALVVSHLGEGPRRTPRYEVRHRFPLGSGA